jgi:hypothetical protein
MWTAGISAQPWVFPKVIDRGKPDPQAADETSMAELTGRFKRMKCRIGHGRYCG